MSCLVILCITPAASLLHITSCHAMSINLIPVLTVINSLFSPSLAASSEQRGYDGAADQWHDRGRHRWTDSIKPY